jgi:hypothetical protein
MRLFFGLFVFTILIACDQTQQQYPQKRHSLNEVKPLFENEAIFENEIKNIDSNSNLTEVTSLEYLSRNGEIFLVQGLVETKNGTNEMTLKKLSFKKISNNGNETNCSFYYLGIRKFSSFCERLTFKGDVLKKVITKSYYNDSSQVFFSKRLSGNAENIDESFYKLSNPENHSDKLALSIINQEGEFETNFQGFTENSGKNYLILGTKSFTSAVAFTEYNSTLRLLMRNEKKFIGKKLIVDFSVQNELGGFTFQQLNNIRIAP